MEAERNVKKNEEMMCIPEELKEGTAWGVGQDVSLHFRSCMQIFIINNTRTTTIILMMMMMMKSLDVSVPRLPSTTHRIYIYIPYLLDGGAHNENK